MVTPLERLWTDRATVREFRNVKDPLSRQTAQSEVVVYDNIPCRLSYKQSPATSQGGVPTASQSIKLILSPAINIKPGSTVVVTGRGQTVTYKASGKPAVYSGHQEISLEYGGRA